MRTLNMLQQAGNALKGCNSLCVYSCASGGWVDFINHLQWFITEAFSSTATGFLNLSTIEILSQMTFL